MHPTDTLPRRTFLKTTALAAAALGAGCSNGLVPALRQGRRLAPGQKMRIACIGCGGKGISDVTGVSGETIVALCDVDAAQAKEIFGRYPAVPKFQDYRQMLREFDDRIDAVTISTPDHLHYAAGLLAISMGKHVFIQKPLTRSVREARELMVAARRHGVVTQMGN